MNICELSLPTSEHYTRPVKDQWKYYHRSPTRRKVTAAVVLSTVPPCLFQLGLEVKNTTYLFFGYSISQVFFIPCHNFSGISGPCKTAVMGPFGDYPVHALWRARWFIFSWTWRWERLLSVSKSGEVSRAHPVISQLLSRKSASLDQPRERRGSAIKLA